MTSGAARRNASTAVRFATVDVKDIAVEPVRAGLDQGDDRVRDVVWLGEAARRVLAQGDLADAVGVGDLVAVEVTPAQMALAEMPRGPSSKASCRTCVSRAAAVVSPIRFMHPCRSVRSATSRAALVFPHCAGPCRAQPRAARSPNRAESRALREIARDP